MLNSIKKSQKIKKKNIIHIFPAYNYQITSIPASISPTISFYIKSISIEKLNVLRISIEPNKWTIELIFESE